MQGHSPAFSPNAVFSLWKNEDNVRNFSGNFLRRWEIEIFLLPFPSDVMNNIPSRTELITVWVCSRGNQVRVVRKPNNFIHCMGKS